MTKRISLSLLTIVTMLAMMVGSTSALFWDEEVSKGNTFAAGEIELKIDYDGYYNKKPDGKPNAGHWELKNLRGEKFFNFDDIKPGDHGEGTISLHLDSNPGYLTMFIRNLVDRENGLTEPERNEPGCNEDGKPNGELDEHLMFRVWIDWGCRPGFGHPNDPGEGDNIRQCCEPMLTRGKHGWVKASEGEWTFPRRMQPSTTYYLGIEWKLPRGTENCVQSDILKADIGFSVEQARHNRRPADLTTEEAIESCEDDHATCAE